MYQGSVLATNMPRLTFELKQANISRRFLRGNDGFFIWISPRDKGKRKRRKDTG
ncbi:MAG: hypothetical protein ACYSWP_22340 [Planctomycetota bacterium]